MWGGKGMLELSNMASELWCWSKLTGNPWQARWGARWPRREQPPVATQQQRWADGFRPIVQRDIKPENITEQQRWVRLARLWVSV